MGLYSRRLWHALTRSGAATSTDAEDPRLRGRTYAIPFEDVWQVALQLAGGGLRRWRMVEADDREGVIRAEARPLLFGAPSDVVVRIGLDEDAQTRVDARAVSRSARADLGAGARRIGRLLRVLDRRLARRPARQAAAPPTTR